MNFRLLFFKGRLLPFWTATAAESGTFGPFRDRISVKQFWHKLPSRPGMADSLELRQIHNQRNVFVLHRRQVVTSANKERIRKAIRDAIAAMLAISVAQLERFHTLQAVVLRPYGAV